MSNLARMIDYGKASKPPKVPNPQKAIYAVKKIVRRKIPTIHQSRGVACVVNVRGKKRLLTWHGVINENNQAEQIILHRFSPKLFNLMQQDQLEMSKIKETGICSFISVKGGDGAFTEKFSILNLKVPESDEKINVVAHSLIGSKDIVKFTFKDDELDSADKNNFIFEESAILGSPIITDKGHVIGVVGKGLDGQLCPCFLTEKELGHKEKDAIEAGTGTDIKDRDSGNALGTQDASGDVEKDAIENGNNEIKEKGGSCPQDTPDASGYVEVITQLQQMHRDTSKGNYKTDLAIELKNIALDKGFRVIDNEGLGNCMFNALSDQLEIVLGIKIKHDELRQTLVQFLRKNPKLPNETDLFHFVHGHQSWADYLTCMEQDGAWGDHVILLAAANCYNTCIRVVSSLNASHDVIVLPQCPVDRSRTLLLGHIHEVHYVSLRSTQDPIGPTKENLEKLTDEIIKRKATSPVPTSDQSTSENQEEGLSQFVSGRGKSSSSAEAVPAFESTGKIRSGNVPPEWFSYLALDIMEGKVQWKTFGRSLNLTEADKQSIDKDNNEEYERYYKMLKTWGQRGSASYDNLSVALREHGLQSTRDNYCLTEKNPPVKEVIGLPGNVKEGPIDGKTLTDIADDVKEKRRQLGRALGLKDERLYEIEQADSDNVREQSYQILNVWVRANGEGASYYALAQALSDRTVSLGSVVNKFCLKKK